jgi:hypothetical protein
LASATRVPFKDRSIGWALSAAVSHHLDDDELGAMVDEVRRVVSDRFVFLDAVLSPSRTSRMLWRYERGRHPRTATALKRALGARFELVSSEEFSVRHNYLLVTAASS